LLSATTLIFYIETRYEISKTGHCNCTVLWPVWVKVRVDVARCMVSRQ